MSMNLRLTEENETAVRKQAEREGVSMNALVNRAVNEYVARRRPHDVVRTEIGFALAEHHELLDKLK